MEEIKRELKNLNDRFEAITKRIEVIPEEVSQTEKKIHEKEQDLSKALKSVEETRQERQRALVSGGKVDSISKSIKEFWEKIDLIEDEILGLKAKIRDLHSEKEDAFRNKDLCQDEIIRTRLIPFFEAYNKNAEATSDALKGMLSLMDEYNLSFGDGWGRFISCSSWIGLRVVPRLGQSGENPGEDFFNITKIVTERNQEQLTKAFRLAQHTPGSEA